MQEHVVKAALAIERKPVDSSQILSVGYDPTAKLMAIQFKTFSGAEGAVYGYENVEQEVADGFFREKDDEGKKWSVGRHFGATLKKDPTKYPYAKLAPAK